jgi:hypothetical protein
VRIHLLVEGPSEAALLNDWIPRLRLPTEVRVYPHAGKGKLPDQVEAPPNPRDRSLLHQLPAKLRAFGKGTDPVVILVDADDDACGDLKARIAAMVAEVAPKLSVVVRIAVEETESFYLGDWVAIREAFPNADRSHLEDYKPDSICGAWELFGRVVDDQSENKVAWASAMARTLAVTVERNASPSFRAFVRALQRVATPAPAPPPRKRRFRPTARTSRRRG